MRLLLAAIFMSLCVPSLWAQEAGPLYLDPENAVGAKASVLFSDIELIPLETTDESYFSNTVDFVVTPEYFVFLDNISNAVLIFDRQGKFVHRYKKKKYALQSIQYLPAKNALFITGRNKNYTIRDMKAQQMIAQPGKRNFAKYTSLELLHLDKDSGYRVESLPVPKFSLANLIAFGDQYLFVSERYNKYIKDTTAYHLYIAEGNEVVKSYFPYLNIPKLAPYYEGVNFSVNPSPDGSSLLIQKEFDNTIYKLTKDSLAVLYRFVFPADQSMSGDFLNTLYKNNIEFNTAKNKNKKVIAGYNNIMEHGNLLFFSFNRLSYASNSFLFNKSDNKLLDLSKITSDSTVYFLPPAIFTRISQQDAGHVYSRISSTELLREKDKLLAKKDELPEKVRELLKNYSKFDNPVIIQLKVNNPATAQ